MLRFDEQLSAKVLKRVGQLRRLGPRGVVRTAYVRMLGPAFYSLTDTGRNVARGLHRHRVLGDAVSVRIERLKRRVNGELRWDAAPLLSAIDPGAEAQVAPLRRAGIPFLIGQFGCGATFLSRIGRIRGLKCVSEGTFLPRPGPGQELVDLEGHLGVRILFGSDSGRFAQTLEAMLDLAAADCSVPRVVDVDWSSNAITTAFTPGILCAEHFERDRSRELIERIEDAILAIHRAGYVLEDIDEDSVVVTAAGEPVVVDLHHAMPLAGLSRDMSVYLRDIDSRQSNDRFGTALITADSLRRLDSPPAVDRPVNGRQSDHFYAPVVIRDDIRWGKIWNTDVGIGRWNFIMKEHLPIPRGGRVLDLGSNNGFNPLQMLRSGAASAVGVEIDERAIRQGEFLKKAYEWLDNRCYDFRYIHGSQGDIATFELPRFDVVTALCSLYYLGEKEMQQLVGYIRTLTDVLVLQCNTDRLIARSDEETYKKASVSFAVEIMEAAGFTNREIIAPPGYSRPLVIGRA